MADPPCNGVKALWSRSNPEEQGIVKLSPQYAAVLRAVRPELVQVVQPGSLWPHLRKYQVLDEAVQQRIQLNATTQDMVSRLVDHLECGPSYRLHAFLRACYLTRQQHVIRLIGFDEEIYAEGLTSEDLTSTPTSSATTTVRASTSGGLPLRPSSTKARSRPGSCIEVQPLLDQKLKKVLTAHCESYLHHVMVGKVFDFKHGDSESDLYDVNACYIHQDVDFKQYKRVDDCIKMKDILKPFRKHCRPRTVLLVGPPGAGKSTFFKRCAYIWSQEFLEYVQNLSTQPQPDLMVLVYVPARMLTTDIWGSIESELCCKKDNKAFLINEVKAGKLNEKSAIFVDGLDEVRDQEVLEAMRTFVKSTHKDGGPQIIVSARTGLSRMDKSSFDRFLHLEGFTMEEGLAYVNKYITLNSQETSRDPSSSTSNVPCVEHPVLSYINRNKDKLNPILQNPLRAHILSGLAVEGLIELDDNNIIQSVDLLTTMENFFIKRETAGKGVTTAEAQRFYRLCLYGLLKNIREFMDSHLNNFGVQGSAYVSFLRRHTKRDKFANNVTYYQFEHEMLYEFFGARAIETLDEGMKKAIVLHVCSQEIFRNLQKLIFGILGEFGTGSTVPLLVGMVHLILLQQALSSYQTKGELQSLSHSQRSRYREWIEFVSNLDTLFDSINSTIPTPGDILQTQDGEDALRDGAVTRIWDMVGTTFSQLTSLTMKNQSPYGDDYWVGTFFAGANDYGFVGEVLLDLLSDCTPKRQIQIADKSYLLMLPCHTVYRCGSSKWMVNAGSAEVRCWSPADVAAAVPHRKGPAHSRVTTDKLCIDFRWTPSQWGCAPYDHWTRTAWDTALTLLMSHYNITGELLIHLPDKHSTPLKDLLYSLTHLSRTDYPGAAVEVHCGYIRLSDLHQWHQVLIEAGAPRRRFNLRWTTLQLPAEKHTWGEHWVESRFLKDVKQHVTVKGQTKGYLGGDYPLTDDSVLQYPYITFI